MNNTMPIHVCMLKVRISQESVAQVWIAKCSQNVAYERTFKSARFKLNKIGPMFCRTHKMVSFLYTLRLYRNSLSYSRITYQYLCIGTV